MLEMLGDVTPVNVNIKAFPKALAIEAVRGVQAGRTFWTAQVPLRTVINLFVFHEEALTPGREVQREVNQTRVRKISRYVEANLESYVFNSLTVSAETTEFVPVSDSSNLGVLYFAEGTPFIINDGQHRVKALQQLWVNSDIRRDIIDETISVDFRSLGTVQRQQQIFSDLNLNLQKPSKSTSRYFNHADRIADLARALEVEVRSFSGRINRQRNQLRKKDTELLTFSTLYEAVKRSLGDGKGIDVDDLIQVWKEVAHEVVPWRQSFVFSKNQDTFLDHRENHICCSSVGACAVGVIVGRIVRLPKSDRASIIDNLNVVDWDRRAGLWNERCVFDGKLKKTQAAIVATAKALANDIGMEDDA